MKNRIKSKGRRGARNRRHDEKQERYEARRLHLAKEQEKRRRTLISRIRTRVDRFCRLSEIGVAAPTGLTEQKFYSVEGPVAGWMSSPDHFYKQFQRKWEQLTDAELEQLAKTKRWDPILPKNYMTIIAEAATGLHPNL